MDEGEWGEEGEEGQKRIPLWRMNGENLMSRSCDSWAHPLPGLSYSSSSSSSSSTSSTTPHAVLRTH
ncbi:hypothetical protein E2C01_070551 [Portunus trituberculatus]|uniref:Uncharacterized protein n=1 Tax=Portunus trituberculatus TaxID=210409 RepID=A0A5B7I2E5_PORTR|nr:hypothetical protein [Portunus trituberculatus]